MIVFTHARAVNTYYFRALVAGAHVAHFAGVERVLTHTAAHRSRFTSRAQHVHFAVDAAHPVDVLFAHVAVAREAYVLADLTQRLAAVVVAAQRVTEVEIRWGWCMCECG